METQTLDFRADDWFTIKGRRGWVATFNNAEMVRNGLYDPRQMVDQEITIDGNPYQVRAVETWADLMSTPERPYRGNFAYLVNGEPPADWPARRVTDIEPLPELERPRRKGAFPAIWMRPQGGMTITATREAGPEDAFGYEIDVTES